MSTIAKTSGYSMTADIVEKKYRYWRTRIVFTLIIGYAAFYIVRQNFPVATKEMLKEFGCTKADIGWVFTAFSLIYGLGKFFGGIVCDRVSARWFMSAGLLASAACNLLMGHTHSIITFAILYSLLGVFQSAGWPPISRLMTQWYSPRELGTKWALVSSAHQIGSITILIMGSAILNQFGWRYVFIIPAIISTVVAIFIAMSLRDTPRSLGLPSIEEKENIFDNAESKMRYEEDITIKEVFLKYILKNKAIWYMSIAYFFVYLVRMGIFHWAPLFLQEKHGLTLDKSAMTTACYEAMGIIGGFVAGIASDKIFRGKRNLASVYFMGALILILLAFWLNTSKSAVVNTAYLATIGLLIYGPQTLIGLAGAESGSLKAAATTNGLVSAFGSFGSAASGWCLGKVADKYGWNAVFLCFVAGAIISSFFFMLNRNETSVKMKKANAK